MEKDRLKDYFQRIGVQYASQGLKPNLATLQMLHAHHTRKIPFENLNPLLGIPVNLDKEAIEQKLIYAGRGGYCYEQNLLFLEVLKTLGFEAVGLEARVLAGPENPVLPRTHMLLWVNIGKAYMVDVGFGGLTPSAPLLLEPETIQGGTRETYRLLYTADMYTLQVKVQEAWKGLYCFDMQVQQRADFEVANWYNSTHPDATFVNNLMVARKSEKGRFTVNNNKFTKYDQQGAQVRRSVGSADELIHILEEVFMLNISSLPGIDSRLNQIISFETNNEKNK